MLNTLKKAADASDFAKLHAKQAATLS